MRILYDLIATQPTSGKYHGGGEYGKVVFKHLLKQESDETIIGIWNPELWMDPSLQELIEEHEVSLIEVTKSADLQNALGRVDRFYSALPYEHHGLNFSGVELIMTIHGLRPMEMPTDRYEIKYDGSLRGITKYILKHVLKPWYVKWHRWRFLQMIQSRAQKKTIIVPSWHTKYALLDAFPSLPPSRVQVLYSPDKKAENQVDVAELEKLEVEAGHYVLLVSGERWRKKRISRYSGVRWSIRAVPAN